MMVVIYAAQPYIQQSWRLTFYWASRRSRSRSLSSNFRKNKVFKLKSVHYINVRRTFLSFDPLTSRYYVVYRSIFERHYELWIYTCSALQIVALDNVFISAWQCFLFVLHITSRSYRSVSLDHFLLEIDSMKRKHLQSITWWYSGGFHACTWNITYLQR